MDRLARERESDADIAPGWAIFRATLIVVATVGAALALWRASDVVLLAFTSVLLAILLRAAARPIAHHLGLSDGLSLLAAGLGILCVLAGALYLFGSQMAAQLSDLSTQIPKAMESIQKSLGIANLWQQVGEQLRSSLASVFSNLTNVVSTVSSAAANAVFMVIAGVFIALNPELYRKGLLLMFADPHRDRVASALDYSGRALEQWLLGQLISMVLVGSLMAVALYLVGLPSPLALALIAGIMEFIPLLGPILGGIPAMLVALSQSPNMALWTLAAILIVQQLESNMIMPLVQRRMVSLPPALTLFAVLASGAIFGFIGLLIATPLAVLCSVFVTKLYIRDALGEDVKVPGEKARPGSTG